MGFFSNATGIFLPSIGNFFRWVTESGNYYFSWGKNSAMFSVQMEIKLDEIFELKITVYVGKKNSL
jgi:hypothetical protein